MGLSFHKWSCNWHIIHLGFLGASPSKHEHIEKEMFNFNQKTSLGKQKSPGKFVQFLGFGMIWDKKMGALHLRLGHSPSIEPGKSLKRRMSSLFRERCFNFSNQKKTEIRRWGAWYLKIRRNCCSLFWFHSSMEECFCLPKRHRIYDEGVKHYLNDDSSVH